MPDGGVFISRRSYQAAAFAVWQPSAFPPPAPRPVDPGRHPWLSEFEKSPEAAFGDLIAGYSPIAPYDRLNAAEAAEILFGQLPADDPARMSLGWAIFGWLQKRRRETPPQAYPQRQRWIRQVRETFDIVSLLGVTEVAVELRRNFVSWNAWTRDLVLEPSRDARAGYWTMLALTQPLLRAAAPDIDGWSLYAQWLQLCENAGGSLPDHYLGIGLIGLRRLPDAEPGGEDPWLTGLAWWAAARRPTQDQFRTQWLALKSLYPRTPEYWRDRVRHVLSVPKFRDQGIVSPGWWAADPDFL